MFQIKKYYIYVFEHKILNFIVFLFTFTKKFKSKLVYVYNIKNE